jgi:uncharacterized repeat protein (TIGR01451 family)
MMSASARIAMVVVALLSFAALSQGDTRYIKRPKNGPVKVHFENVSKAGSRIEALEFTSLDLPPLPQGYTALRNEAFRISTSAITTGLHSVLFAVPSVKEEREFRNVRILQFGNDSLWRDVTVLDFDQVSPVFPARTILAQSESLGVYVLAQLAPDAPPNKSSADLVVSIHGAPDRLTSPSLISYTIKVLNRGPDNATDIAVWDGLAHDANLVSAEPSQGRCKEILRYIDCKLGSLKPGESTDLAVKLKPFEGMYSFPKEGQKITHDVGASAAEHDPRTSNNKASDTVLVFPDPNQGPIVTLNYPRQGAQFETPANITLEAAAFDTDGSISKVEFFELGNDKPLGLGTSVDGKSFVFTAQGLAPGEHSFLAVATDNGGREAWSAYISISITGARPH